MTSTERQKEWYRENLVRERAKRTVYSRAYRKSYPERRMYAGAQERARNKGLPLTITPEDIEIPDRCPVFDVEMIPNTPYAPSLDRKIPELGYTPSNIQVISRKANLMKQDASPEELERFARWVLKQ